MKILITVSKQNLLKEELDQTAQDAVFNTFQEIKERQKKLKTSVYSQKVKKVKKTS
jgi:hypothetical protein